MHSIVDAASTKPPEVADTGDEIARDDIARDGVTHLQILDMDMHAYEGVHAVCF